MVSFEMQAKSPPPYTDASVRAALATLTTRATVPVDEQLRLVPFRIGETAGMRLVRVVPGVAAQFTDGPKDSLEATDQSQLVIAAARRRTAAAERPRSVRENRAERTAADEGRADQQLGTDADRRPGRPRGAGAGQGRAEPAPRSRSCNGCGSAPAPICASWGLLRRSNGPAAFTRFRAVRDGLEPR